MILSADLLARQVVLHSWLYYGLDTSLISDHEFDAMCQEVARRWDELSTLRKWQLGSPDKIRASGFHTKITSPGVYAAIDMLGKNIGIPAFNWSKTHKVSWLPVSTKCNH